MKTKLFSVFKTSPGNTAGKGSDFQVGLMDGNTINRDILGLKTVLGLMAGTYGTCFCDMPVWFVVFYGALVPMFGSDSISRQLNTGVCMQQVR